MLDLIQIVGEYTLLSAWIVAWSAMVTGNLGKLLKGLK